MPLAKGTGKIRQNMQELMTGHVGATRKKAIVTLAKRRNISANEARFVQAKAIAVSQGRKK